MEITKIVGAACGSLLVFLLIQTAAHGLVSPGSSGHGEYGHAEHAYVIEVEDGAAEEEEEVVEIVFADVYATADAAAGEKLFGRKCASCHKVEAGANATGPYLYGVVGRALGAADGYGYSAAVADHGGNWAPEEIFAFLENPGAYVSGTKMALKTPKVQDRVDLIAYLETLQ